MLAHFARRFRQLFYNRGRIVPKGDRSPRYASDHYYQDQCRPHDAGNAPGLKPVHDRAQCIACKNADQQWHEEGARQVERGDNSDDGENSDTQRHGQWSR